MSLLAYAPDESLARGTPSVMRRLAGRLIGLAVARGEAGPAEPAQPVRPRRPNLCEFDYDYYVELQRRRAHRPDRLDRVQALPFPHDASEAGQKTSRPDEEAMVY